MDRGHVRESRVVDSLRFLREEFATLTHQGRGIFLQPSYGGEAPHPQHALLIDPRDGDRVFRHRMQIEGVKVRRGDGRAVQHLHQVFHSRGVRHELLPVVTEGDGRQFEIDPARILGSQLVNLRHVHEPDRKKRDVLVRVFEEVFHPLHGLGMEEQIGPLHIFVPTQTPELHGIGRLLVDVIQDEFPIFLAGLGRFKRLAIGVVQLVTELALDGAFLAQTDGDFSGFQFPNEYLSIVLPLENWSGSEHGKWSGHGSFLLQSQPATIEVDS